MFVFDPDPTYNTTGANSLLQGFDLEMLKKQLSKDNQEEADAQAKANAKKQPPPQTPTKPTGPGIALQQYKQRSEPTNQPGRTVHSIGEHGEQQDEDAERNPRKAHSPDVDEDYDPHARSSRNSFAHNIIAEAFQPTLHPRDPEGEFTSKPGGAAAHHEQTRVINGKRYSADGSPLPEHIEALRIPPAWTDVTYSKDPKASLLATGKDAKGRKQAVYSADFSAKQAEAKFARIDELNDKFDDIYKHNEQARKSDDIKKRAAADCAYLIMKTGIRPGSEDDTGADKKAYGATTLEGKHVIIDGANTSLQFVGKKGVQLHIPIHDKAVAKMLHERKQTAGPDGQLFPINEKNLLDHVHSFDGGGFKTKDLRTRLAVITAVDEIRKHPTPKNVKDYKKAVMNVAKEVAKKLGNTPSVALASYINPRSICGLAHGNRGINDRSR